MAEKDLDFDTVIDRTHTNSLKYDFAVQRGKPKDVLPLWVADMDFQVSSYIQEALAGSVAHGIFGYSEAAGSYFEAVAGWMGRHYGWNVGGTLAGQDAGDCFCAGAGGAGVHGAGRRGAAAAAGLLSVFAGDPR